MAVNWFLGCVMGAVLDFHCLRPGSSRRFGLGVYDWGAISYVILTIVVSYHGKANNRVDGRTGYIIQVIPTGK